MRPPRPRQNHPAGWGRPRRTRGQLQSRCSFCEDVAPCWQLRKVTAGAGLAAWRRGAQGDPPPGEPACDVNKGRTCPLSAQSERPEGSSPGVTLSTSRGFSLPRAAQGGATGSAPGWPAALSPAANDPRRVALSLLEHGLCNYPSGGSFHGSDARQRDLRGAGAISEVETQPGTRGLAGCT